MGEVIELSGEERRKVMLDRLQDRFASIVEEIVNNPRHKAHQRTKKELAEYVGLKGPLLTALTLKREDKAGSMRYPTRLSNTYLMPFIVKGVIMVDQIFDGKPESERERRFWRRASLQEAINEAESQGLDPEKLLRDEIAKIKSVLEKTKGAA
jgi:hypothetical protein